MHDTRLSLQKCLPATPVSPAFLAPRTGFMEDNFSTDQDVGDGFGTFQAHCIYCALYFYYYYIVIYNEIITQLTIMHNEKVTLNLIS